ncbi:hypothetical protein FLL45_11285 [Aliikangiella marina]|uniref:B box-type domain-containing protein n=1 Tax=Aliikangiella marina TaxID=1712262 RepID=A0A545TE42_9GAMM|nr:B-box zinc finger protein [Aliikangiella marina]TQV75492.1 hypothetical protein FLL45_11285 [Aliikangiella marina]
MSQFCKYHPKNHAAWFCQSCETLFCSLCVPEDKDNYFPKCTLCRRSLQSLSVAHRIPPFWAVLPDILTRPFNAGILAFAVMFSLIFAGLPSNVVGLILAVFATLPVIELLFEVMERTASGDKLQKGIQSYINFRVHSQSLKLLFGTGVFMAVLGKLYLANPSIGALSILFFVLGIPATLIILMMEKSVFSMFNPIKIGFLIKLFGSAYFLLYAVMLAVAFLSVKVSGVNSADSVPFFGQFLLYFFILYLTISVAVMAGYLVYQYHHELNFTIDRTSLHQLKSEPEVGNMAEVDIFIQEARYEDAQKLLLTRINDNPSDYKSNEKLILLYAIQGKDEWIKKVADQYFETMVQINNTKQAVDFFQKLQDRGVVYSPSSFEVVASISREMQNKNQFKTALRLIDDFLAISAKPKGWESLYLIKAQLLFEFANRSTDAIDTLNQVINRSIDQEIMQQAEDYLRLIK